MFLLMQSDIRQGQENYRAGKEYTFQEVPLSKEMTSSYLIHFHSIFVLYEHFHLSVYHSVTAQKPVIFYLRRGGERFHHQFMSKYIIVFTIFVHHFRPTIIIVISSPAFVFPAKSFKDFTIRFSISTAVFPLKDLIESIKRLIPNS